MAFLPIHTSAQIRRIEQAALDEGQPLMERAGAAAATLAQQLLADRPRSPGRRVLLVAGPGNNGGDAFECAVHLKRAWFPVTVAFIGERGKLPPDAQAALAKWEAAGGVLESDIPADVPGTRPWDLVVDGLFGIGLSRPLRGRHADCVARINALDVPVLSLDVPSGLNADTGAVMGNAVRAAHTLTFIARKPGLLTLDGPDHCGILHCDELGLQTASEDSQLAPGFLLDNSVLQGVPRRPRNFHKGRAGDVGVLGGAEGMVGAALLSARAALRMGSGRVFVGFLAKHAPAVDFTQPELMMRHPAQVLAECPVLVLGPGMGTSDDSGELLEAALAGKQTLVLDADALNLIGAHEPLAALAAEHDGPMVMTPHPAEAARLLGVETAEVQRDRPAAAQALAQRYRCLILLKGNGSLLAEPSGGWCINPSGNPGMASAGMGDALAGMLASLLAQGLPPARALQLAVWTHGAAADELVAAGRGPLGITASDVIVQAAAILNRTLNEQH